MNGFFMWQFLRDNYLSLLLSIITANGSLHHQTKCQVRHYIQHEDSDLVIRQVLEILGCNILRINTEHPAMYR